MMNLILSIGCYLFQKLRKDSPPRYSKRYKDFIINRKTKRLFIDSGSNLNLLTLNTLKELAGDKIVYLNSNENMPCILPYASENPLEVIAIADLTVVSATNANEEAKTSRFYAIKDSMHDMIGYVTANEIFELSWKDRSANGRAQMAYRALELEYPTEMTPYPALPDFELKLNTDDAITPTVRSFFVMKPGEENKVRAAIEEMLKHGVIQKATYGAPWVSPMLTVTKADGGLRICVDMTLVNKAIIRTPYKMPTIEEMQEFAAGHKIFAKFDMEKAFYHIVMDPATRHLTTFYTPFGYFEFLRMPFGLNVAPETFQQRVDLIVNAVPGAKAYIDDILVVADSREQLKERCNALLHELEKNNLTVNHAKTVYGEEEITFVGFALSGTGIRLTRDRIEAFERMKLPKTIPELRSFLGHVVFMQSFIPRCSDIASPLWAMLGRSNIEWGRKTKQAFKELKSHICEGTLKNHFRSDRETVLITDASETAGAAVLVQFDKNSTNPYPIAFASTLFKAAETRYEQYQKELNAIQWALKHFDKWLKIGDFTILTDLKAAPDVIYRTPGHCKSSNKRDERITAVIREYNCKIVALPGKLNIADCLSRMAAEDKTITNLLWDEESEEHQENERNLQFCNLCSIDELKVLSCESVRQEIPRDSEISEVLRCVREHGKIPDKHELKSKYTERGGSYWEIDDILMKGHAIVMPRTLRRRAVEIAHATHRKFEGTFQFLNATLWWPSITDDVKQFGDACEVCAMARAESYPEPMTRVEIPEIPWTMLAADFFDAKSSSGSYVQVFGIMDYTSRFLRLFMINNKTAESTIEILRMLTAEQGFFLKLRTDGGPPFGSKALAYWSDCHSIHHDFSTPYHAAGNGLIEREFFEVKNVLKCATIEKKPYRVALDEHQLYHNNTKHSTTGELPMVMLNNRRARIGLPQIESSLFQVPNMNAIFERDAKLKEKGRVATDKYVNAKPSGIEVGDMVWMRRANRAPKLDTQVHEEKFEVISKEGTKYELRSRRNVTFWRTSDQIIKCPSTDANPIEETSSNETQNEQYQQTKLNAINVGDLVWVRLPSRTGDCSVDVLPHKYEVISIENRKLKLKRVDSDEEITREIEKIIRCPPIDTDELTESILSDINDRVRLERLGENGRSRDIVHKKVNDIPIAFFPSDKDQERLQCENIIQQEATKQVAKQVARRQMPARKCKQN